MSRNKSPLTHSIYPKFAKLANFKSSKFCEKKSKVKYFSSAWAEEIAIFQCIKSNAEKHIKLSKIFEKKINPRTNHLSLSSTIDEKLFYKLNSLYIVKKVRNKMVFKKMLIKVCRCLYSWKLRPHWLCRKYFNIKLSNYFLIFDFYRLLSCFFLKESKWMFVKKDVLNCSNPLFLNFE